MKCPICKSEVNDVRDTPYCPICQWELIEIPSSSSTEMHRYYDMLTACFKECYAQTAGNKLLAAEVEANKNEIRMQSEKKEHDSEMLKAKQQELENLKQQLRHLRAVSEQLTQTEKDIHSTEQSISTARDILRLSSDYDELLKQLLDDFLVARYNGYGPTSEMQEIENFLKSKKLIQ